MSSHAWTSALVAALAVVAACGPRHVPAAASDPSPHEQAQCDAVREALQLLEEGWLHRGIRQLEEARLRCPSYPSASGTLAVALADLGRYDDAARLAEDTLASAQATPQDRAHARRTLALVRARDRHFPHTAEARAEMRALFYAATREQDIHERRRLYLEAWAAWHPNGRALAAAAGSAEELGDHVEARRLRDRAVYELELANGSEVRPYVQVGSHGRPTALAWSPGSSRAYLAVAFGRSVTVLQGRTFYEQAVIESSLDAQQLSFERAAATTLLVVSDGTDDEAWSMQYGSRYCKNCGSDARDEDVLQVRQRGGRYELFDTRTDRSTVLSPQPASIAYARAPRGPHAGVVVLDEAGTLGIYSRNGQRRHAVRVAGPVAAAWDGAVAFADSDGAVKVWRAQQLSASQLGDPRTVLSSRLARATDVRAVNATLVANYYEDGLVRIWNRSTGQLAHALAPGVVPVQIALAPEGKRLALRGEEAIRIVDLERKQERDLGITQAVDIAFARNGSALVVQTSRDSGARRDVVVLDLASGSRQVLQDRTIAPRGLDATGSRLALSSRSWPNAYQIVDLENDTASEPIEGQFFGFATTGHLRRRILDRPLVVRGRESSRELLEHVVGERVRKVPVPVPDDAIDMFGSPDGSLVATITMEAGQRIVSVFRTQNGSRVSRVRTSSAPSSGRFTTDGECLVLGNPSEGESEIYPTGSEKGLVVRNWKHAVSSHSLFSTEDGNLREWSLEELIGRERPVDGGPPQVDPRQSFFTVEGMAHGCTLSSRGDVVVTGREIEKDLSCQFGATGFPFELCRDRVVRQTFEAPRRMGSALAPRPEPAPEEQESEVEEQEPEMEDAPPAASSPQGEEQRVKIEELQMPQRVQKPIAAVDVSRTQLRELRPISFVWKALRECVRQHEIDEQLEVSVEFLVTPEGRADQPHVLATPQAPPAWTKCVTRALRRGSITLWGRYDVQLKAPSKTQGQRYRLSFIVSGDSVQHHL